MHSRCLLPSSSTEASLSIIHSVKECPFGDTCKYDHDIQAYFSRREPDIGPLCPVWSVHGYCPVGLNCRWAQSHVTEDLKLVYKKEQIPIEEVGGDGGV